MAKHDQTNDRKNPRKNEEIRAPKVRAIGADGANLGVMRTQDALRLAREAGLDLVEVSPQAAPPTCKIADYGKFRYEAAKKEKEAKKSQKAANDQKETRLTPGIGAADLETKARATRKFLAEGRKVRVSLKYRGRETTRPEEGLRTMAKFLESLSDVADVWREPKMEGRFLNATLAPKKQAAGAAMAQKGQDGADA